MIKETSQTPADDSSLHANISALDKEILIAQNSFLIDELNKYKALHFSHQMGAEPFPSECHCSLRISDFFNRFKDLFELFGLRLKTIGAGSPNDSALKAFTDFLAANFSAFGRIVDLCTFADEQPIDFEAISNSFDELAARLKKEFGQGERPAASAEFQVLQDKLQSLENLNSSLLAKLDSLCKENEAQRTQLENPLTLKMKVEDATWKKHLLEKRVIALSSLLSRSFEQGVKEMFSSPFHFCYCGGKLLGDLASRISPEVHAGVVNRTDLIVKSMLDKNFCLVTELAKNGDFKLRVVSTHPQNERLLALAKQNKANEQQQINLPENKSASLLALKDEKQKEEPKNLAKSEKEADLGQILSVEALKEQLKLMQEEIKELVEEREKRRIDKAALMKNLLSTKFFKKIISAHQSNLDHIEFLDAKLQDSYAYLLEIESLRKKELGELRERELKEREKLVGQLTQLKREAENWRLRAESGKSVKEMTFTGASPQENSQVTNQNVVASLQKKIEFLLKTIIPGLEEKVKMRDSRLKTLEEELDKLRSLPVEQLVSNSEFRHKTHAAIFALIKEQINPQTLEKMTELEKYVKNREEKISDLEKSAKQQAKDLANERVQASSLIDELSRSAETFSELQNSVKALKSELSASEQNFNALFRERQIEKTALESRLSEAENNCADLREQLSLRSQQADLSRGRIAELEEANNGFMQQIKDQILAMNKEVREKSDLVSKLALVEAQSEILFRRNEVFEKSVESLSAELANKGTQIIQKDTIIKELLKTNGVGESEGNLKAGELTLLQKQDYLIKKMELEKLRVGLLESCYLQSL